jgi:hypothetical protein
MGDVMPAMCPLQPSLRERTEDECRIMWANTLYPGINTGKWDAAEDKRLLEMVCYDVL